MSFRAKYDSECINCDDLIEAGHNVEFDEDRNLRHVECAPPPKVCSRCSLTVSVSGACGCPED